MATNRPRKKDPALPITYENGEPVESDIFWENIPKIQLETSDGWWGNVVSDTKIGGDYFAYSDEPITADGEFLARKAALAVKDCSYLKTSKIAKSVSAEVFNPVTDRLETELTVVERSGVGADREVVVTVGDYSKPVTEEYELGIIQDTIIAAGVDIIQDVVIVAGVDVLQDTVIP
jgi:hypothetical protein